MPAFRQVTFMAAALAAGLLAQGAAAQQSGDAAPAPTEQSSGGSPVGGPDSPFGSFKHDSTLPIEITSESLSVNQGTRVATFKGEVVAGQGTMRLTAQQMEIFYDGTPQSGTGSETGSIRLMRAEGDVFLSNGAEAAKGSTAEYDVSKGVITLAGGVVLTQGDNAISGESLWIDLNSGVGEIKGRVKTVFQPGSQN
ncbi:LptA/OstA family protein [Oceanicella sp. SM1341]|uniref:LptA/OstA family protein n=1 Tax=Oceanicella sp. SM1341 TaxID=1548889 RepID=UPI000E486EB1|nr:LptA/OstA family protein [Oceanicella sp. SM1341]